MEQRQSDVLGHVDALLAEGYRMWDSFGLIKLSEAEKHEIPQAAALACRKDVHRKEYAAACQCFFLFRRLHNQTEEVPEEATLLGDYFFSQFSHYLIPIDSTRLIDLFSEYLKQDTKCAADGSREFDKEGYLDFVKKAAKEIAL